MGFRMNTRETSQTSPHVSLEICEADAFHRRLHNVEAFGKGTYAPTRLANGLGAAYIGSGEDVQIQCGHKQTIKCT